MSAGVQQAEAAIKAGDTKTGFEILRQILAENPDSERAWWIMSGLVQRDERATCLEQVLRINPENNFARDALDKLLGSPSAPETKPPREIPKPLPEKKADGKEKLQTWLFARGSKIYLTILGDKRLMRAQTEANLLPKVRESMKKGKIPDQYLSEIKTLALSSVTSIKQNGAALQVEYLDGTVKRSHRLTLEDPSMAQVVLGVLTKRLGNNFILQTKPVRTGITLGISVLLTFGAAGFTAITYWAVQEVISGRAEETGSIQSEVILQLLQNLGSGGAVLVGSITLLVALGVSAWLLLKPRLSTELVQRGQDQ
jgi:RNase P/RNase MRP subunit POP5